MLNDVASYNSPLGRRTFYVGSMFTSTVLTSEKLYLGVCPFKCVSVNVGSNIYSMHSLLS